MIVAAAAVQADTVAHEFWIDVPLRVQRPVAHDYAVNVMVLGIGLPQVLG